MPTCARFQASKRTCQPAKLRSSLAIRPCRQLTDRRIAARAVRVRCDFVKNTIEEEVIQKKGSPVKQSILSVDIGDEVMKSTDTCDVFVDRDGDMVEVMCCDYGFRTGSGRLYQEHYNRIPKNVWHMAWNNYKEEYTALRRSFRYDEWREISTINPNANWLAQVGFFFGRYIVRGFGIIDMWLEKNNLLSPLRPAATPEDNPSKTDPQFSAQCSEIRSKLRELKLSNDAVWNRERERERRDGGVESPVLVKIAYYALCYFLDVFYENRPIQRFWFLETVARMPYFSYISMLHLYESLGWWRAGADLRKVHFAEEWNELHHLQIMESLGGDQLWIDRFMAQHAAIIYYWVLIVLFLLSPSTAYNFSELIESHAVDTYGEFADANEALLKTMPPPLAAAEYYRGKDLYMFDEFQTSRVREPRTPACRNLYDVFENIRDDEGEHVKTMRACQNLEITEDLENRKDVGRRL